MPKLQVLVGMRTDQFPPKFYLAFPGAHSDRDFGSVRGMLDTRLEELEARVGALRAILATDDPEAAERLLCDGARLTVTEVVLKPQSDREAIAAFVEQTFVRE